MVTLPSAPTLYSPFVMCFSSPRLATLFTVAPPSLEYVIRSPSFLIVVVLPPASCKPISFVVTLSVVTLVRSLRSLSRANATDALPLPSLVWFTVKFLPACIVTVLVSLIFWDAAEPAATVPSVADTLSEAMFQEDAAAPAVTCKSYVVLSPFVVGVTVTEPSLDVTTVREFFN